MKNKKRNNKIEIKEKRNKGVTLVALVVTIIVLLILAGVSLAMLTGDNGILTQAQRAKISTELSGYKEQVELFKVEQVSKDSDFLDGSLTAGKNNLFYNTQPTEEQGKGTIKDIIENISDEYLEKLEIIKGELLINTKDNNEIKVAQSLGIQVNPYDIDENGVLLSTGNNLALMDENGTVTIPDSVTEIGAGAFSGSGLKTIIIPGTVKRIASNAFSYNETLENVIMQEGVEEIGFGAFSNCTNLKNVELPETLTLIGNQAFFECSSLQSIEIPSKVKIIYSYLFGGCTSLNEVTLHEGLETIQEYAFSYNTFFEIEIPSTVTSIGNNVFDGNKNLNNIIIKGNEPTFVYEAGLLMNKEKTNILFVSDSYLKNINTFNIPSGIENFNVSISSYENITSITIPDSLKSISNGNLPSTISSITISGTNDKYAVSDTDKILYTKDTKEIVSCFSKDTTIDLKDADILSLGVNSFKQATKAQRIILPDSLTNIGRYAFANNFNVERIEIGANVSSIDPYFKFMNYNGEVIIDEGNSSYKIEDNILYSNKDGKTLVSVLYKINGVFIISGDVKVIGSYSFNYQSEMTEVIISEGVKEIQDSFIFCSALTNVKIPSSVEKINVSCFASSPNIATITVNRGENNKIEGAPWGAEKGMKVVVWNR